MHRAPRALTSGAYRRRHIPLDQDSDDKEEQDDEAMLSPEARAMTKPYFEVLIVDEVNEQQERWLKSNVTRMRRAEDPFHLRGGRRAEPRGCADRGAVQPQHPGHRRAPRPVTEIQARDADAVALPRHARTPGRDRCTAPARLRPRAVPPDRQACARNSTPISSPSGRSRISPGSISGSAAGSSTIRKTSWSCTSTSCAGYRRATRRRSSRPS